MHVFIYFFLKPGVVQGAPPFTYQEGSQGFINIILKKKTQQKESAYEVVQEGDGHFGEQKNA